MCFGRDRHQLYESRALRRGGALQPSPGVVELTLLHLDLGQHGVGSGDDKSVRVRYRRKRALGVHLRVAKATSAEVRKGAEAAGGGEAERGATCTGVLDRGGQRDLGGLVVLAEGQGGGGQVVAEAIRGL